MLVTTQPDSILQPRLSRELAEVGECFVAELKSDLGCVNDLVQHIEQFRGKMLRPTLVIASGMALRPGLDRLPQTHRTIATVVEMVHMATLVHDDILDDAALRRGGATVNYLHGNEAAVMLGDYLISHAYHLCSSLESAAISRVLTRATNTICEGELLQLAHRNDWALDEKTYFDIIRRKTASLCGSCCALAGQLFDVDDPVVKALDDYGQNLGTAFQIVDDVLDLTGDEATVGKTLGRDLEKGKLTLPMIRAIASAETSQRKKLLESLEARRFEGVRDFVLNSGAVESARGTASELVESAKVSLLGVLEDSPARSLMLNMADAVIRRDF